MEEERHKREMALQLEQAKIEAERRRQEREHKLAVLQLLTRNAYMPTTSMQSSVVFVGLPVVDHMDDGIGCFGRACKKNKV